MKSCVFVPLYLCEISANFGEFHLGTKVKLGSRNKPLAPHAQSLRNDMASGPPSAITFT